MKTKFYWHIHHDVLLEPLTEPLKNRIKFIKENKPKDEIELRLKLLKPVRGKLPDEIIKAGRAYDKAGKIYDKTLKKYSKEINELHEKECPNCPWDSKQQTIFPKS